MIPVKTVMNILRISAGRIDSNNQLYANAIIVDEAVADLITSDRIDVGQQHAKVRIDTSDNNRMATLLAQSGLVPGLVEVEIVTGVKSGEATIQIVNFSQKEVKAA